MATWLDWYIQGAADHPMAPKAATDLEFMRQIAILQTASTSVSPGLRLFYGAVLPWLVPPDQLDEMTQYHPVALPPKAYQVTSDLLGRLVSGKAPNTTDHLIEMRKHNLYFDLPGRGLPLTDKQSIRAIFIQPSAQPDTWLVVCILTSGRSNAMTGRYAWIIDSEGEIASTQLGDSIEEGLSPTSINTVVTRVVKLSILYAMTHAGKDLVELPKTTDKALAKLKEKKRKAKHKTHTLFSVHKLEPSARSSLPPSQSSSSWTLDHVVEVRGHFRWQRHGKGNRLRKLLYIDGYVKGKGDKKHSITKI